MLTAERLRELLDYDPETGRFIWRKDHPTAKHIKAGSVAGTKNGRGYWVIGVAGAKYVAHRLAWLYVTGEWPAHLVDHENGDRLDNRFANLREATDSQNNFNRGGAEA
jgi:hypothetical protein